MALVAGVSYGILHDQITARVCAEYFTIGHPPIFPTTSPTLLALGWGVLATWWVALPLGMLLAFAARSGRKPRLAAAELVRPLGVLLVVMACCAFIAGALGFIFATVGWVTLVPDLADRIPASRHNAFLADLWAHSASYLAGIVGGVVLAIQTYRRRGALTQSVASDSAVEA
jgi:hypothetical protein